MAGSLYLSFQPGTDTRWVARAATTIKATFQPGIGFVLIDPSTGRARGIVWDTLVGGEPAVGSPSGTSPFTNTVPWPP